MQILVKLLKGAFTHKIANARKQHNQFNNCMAKGYKCNFAIGKSNIFHIGKCPS